MYIRPLLLALCLLLLANPLSATEHELVLRGGRVIDPETGLDGIRNVAVANGQIVAISEDELPGADIVDVRGLVVAPGFIDLHSHSPTPLGFRYQALDGVTTSLELEAGAYPLSGFGGMLKAGSALNYGASTGHLSIRLKVMQGIAFPHMLEANQAIDFHGPAFTQTATPAQREQIRTLLNAGLDQGGLGIGLALDYVSSAVDSAELRMIFELAGERKAPIFVHIRRGMAGDPAGLYEVIELARATGAPLHICHISHSGMKGTGNFLALIRQAREQGVDITTEVLPYNAGTTTISAAVFQREWQSIFDISYGDVEWAATGERLTKSSWEKYQREQPQGMVIHHYLKEAWTREAIAEPGVIIVTDGTPAVSESIGIPPQGVGSFSRVLGRYSRDAKLIDLQTALAKMSLLPARRLEAVAPAFSRKGRIQVGMDADIVVFDADTIIDNATYAEPFQASTGVRYLLVNGVPVVRQGRFQENTHPGKLVTSRDVGAAQ